VAWGGSAQVCGSARDLTVATTESSPKQSGKEALVHDFRRAGGQSEEELEGKLTKVVAELGRV
jgi:hypothetical protein